MNNEANTLLANTNDAQRAAITAPDGPHIIIAGAGTGKTLVITKRIAWLVAQGKAKPEEILALTFTEKAAQEMEERVDRLLPMGYLDTQISTFHAFCERVLARHGAEIGFSFSLRLLNERDAWMLFRKHLNRFALDYFRPRGNPTKFLKEMLKHFSRAQDEGITPEKYAKHVEALIEQKTGGAPEGLIGLAPEDRLELKKWQELSHAYTLYSKILAEEGAIDFGGLLLGVYELFQERPNVLAWYQAQYKYIIVDEFQDTNTVQYALIKMLAHKHRALTVVGDDDQAIYKFRGAALANILQFRTDFPDAARCVLTQNYRSAPPVLDAAYTLIANNNPHRLEVAEGIVKRLTAAAQEEGFVTHLHAQQSEDECETVMHEITERVTKGTATWGDFAILARSHDSLALFAEALDRYGIPYVYAQPSGLYTKPLIIDLLAYLRVLVDQENGPAWYRVLTHPRIGIAHNDVQEILAFVRRKGCSFFDALQRSMGSIGVGLEGRGVLMELLAFRDRMASLAKRATALEVCVEVVKGSGLLGDIKLLTEAQQKEQFSYLDAFLKRMKRYCETYPNDAHLVGFFQEFDIERESGEMGSVPQDNEQGPDVVSLLTVHAAKGLEFRYVFVVHLVEQRFPSVSRSEALPLPPGLVPHNPELDDHVAEERRLMYVAVTRAKEGLFLTSAETYGGTRPRKRSRFLAEIGNEPTIIPKTSAQKNAEDVINDAAFSQNKGDTMNGVSTIKNKPQIVNHKQEISFSQLAAFTSCPQQYKYAHLLRIPTFGKHQFSFGQTLHLTLHRFLTQVLAREEQVQTSLFTQDHAQVQKEIPSLATLKDIYVQTFIDEWYPSPEIKEEYRKKGLEILEVFYAYFLREQPKPWKLECGFHLPVGEVMVKGRIDRIDALQDGTYEIIDYKTGSPKDTLVWEDKRQLVIYALAAEACFVPPLTISKLTYYYLENGAMVSFIPTEKEKEKLRTYITETVDEMRVSDFSATPDPHVCRYCDFKDICPKAEL